MWKEFAALLLIGVAAGRVALPYGLEFYTVLHRMVEEDCKLYGAEENIEKVTQRMLKFTDCIYNSTDKEAVARLRSARDLDYPNELIIYAKTTCKKQTEINACFHNALDAYSPCINLEVRDKVHVAKEAVVELTNLFCQDNSRSFIEFINDGGYACLNERVHYNGMDLQNYEAQTTAEECAYIEVLSSIILEALESCPMSSTAEFVKTVLETMYKGMLCTVLSEEDNWMPVGF